MMTRSLLLSFTLLILNIHLQAQQRVQIDDADLSFSYILPKGWSNMDDDYYHYLLNSDSTAQITLTYFEGMCASLDDCYLGEVQGRLRTDYTDFKVLYEKTGEIASVPAKWASFTGKMDGVEVKGIAFYLIKDNNFFVINAFMDANATDGTEQLVIDTVKSLKASLK